jgi:GntR family transcriptional regulator
MQEAEKIRRRIASGELKPGDRIPTIAALGAQGVTVTTARAAHQLLREWGLVEGGRGAALRVRVSHRRIVHTSLRHQMEKDRVHLSDAERRTWGAAEHELGVAIGDTDLVSSYSQIGASEELAALFGIDVGAPVLARRYETRERESGYLVQSSVSWLPVALVAGNPRLLDEREEPWPGGTMHQLYTVGVEVARVVERIGARPAIGPERQDWGMERGDDLLVVRRHSIDVRGRVVEVSDAMYPAGRTLIEAVTDLRPLREARDQGQ